MNTGEFMAIAPMFAGEDMSRPALNAPFRHGDHLFASDGRIALVWMKDRMNAAIHDGSFECYEALEKIDAALAAPPRQCDVGTAQEGGAE